MRTTVTVMNLHGDRERMSLPTPLYTHPASGREDSTGIWYTGLFFGPRTGRMVLRTYSIWENRQTHGVIGEQYQEIDRSEFLRVCQHLGVTVPDAIPATVV